MEPFKIHIIGCGSALPTGKHTVSSQIVEIRNKMFLVDCGEGTQAQLRRSHIRFSKISHIFISHLHGDHCLGLVGMLSTFGMLGRTAPIQIFAPMELEKVLKLQIDTFCHGLDYPLVFHATDTNQNKMIYEDHSVEVYSIPLQHRVPCCGFLFCEKSGLPHIRRDIIDMYGISVSQINNIKKGMDGVTASGETIDNALLVYPAEKARRYAYCSDTAYIPSLYRMLEGVDVLYHESTYGKDNEKMAMKYMHSTAEQAATVATDAHVGKLLLGHYSARYEDESVLLEEARSVFPNTVLSDEGMIIEV